MDTVEWPPSVRDPKVPDIENFELAYYLKYVSIQPHISLMICNILLYMINLDS